VVFIRKQTALILLITKAKNRINEKQRNAKYEVTILFLYVIKQTAWNAVSMPSALIQHLGFAVDLINSTFNMFADEHFSKHLASTYSYTVVQTLL
jgi:hypothetical protein